MDIPGKGFLKNIILVIENKNAEFKAQRLNLKKIDICKDNDIV